MRDGYVWGRGAVDIKGMAVLQLVTVLPHRRHGLPLRRDLTFLAVADEEAGSAHGAESLARERPQALRCAFVINEGGRGATETLGVERPVMHSGVAEKGPLWLRLRTRGEAWHGSVPTADNAADRLVRALQCIQEWERPPNAPSVLRRYFEGLARAGVVGDEPIDALLARHAAESARFRALQTDTISVTTLTAGVKHTVIPAEASATLDCRLLPGTDTEAFAEQLRAVIADPAVEVEKLLRSSGPTSPTDTELYQVMTRAVQDVYEDAVIVLGISTGFTDSRIFRRLGSPRTGSARSSRPRASRRSRAATTSASPSSSYASGCRFCTPPCAESAADGGRRRRLANEAWRLTRVTRIAAVGGNPFAGTRGSDPAYPRHARAPAAPDAAIRRGSRQNVTRPLP